MRSVRFGLLLIILAIICGTAGGVILSTHDKQNEKTGIGLLVSVIPLLLFGFFIAVGF